MRTRRQWVLVAGVAGVGGLLTAVATFFADLPLISGALAVVGTVLAAVAGVVVIRTPTRTVTGVVGQAPRVWALPSRLAHFTGRSGELAAIRTCHCRGHRPDVTIVWGIGGVGKTSLALEYAHQVEAQQQLVAWIPAMDRASVMAGLADLGAALAITGVDQDTVVRRTLAGLDQRGSWLLIYDDATPEVLQGLIPTVGDGDVLVTSRDSEWTDVGTTIEVSAMPEDDAIALLLARSQDRSPDANEHARHLAQRLGYLPLAVDLAGAYCHNTCTIGEYRQQLGRVGLALMRRRHNSISPAGNEIAARLSSGRIAGRDKTTAELLLLLAWFAPGYLPSGTITTHSALLPPTLRAAANDPLLWHQHVNRLHAAGLIRAQPGLLWIHQLVQEVQRDLVTERATVRTRPLRQAATWITRSHTTAGWAPRRWKTVVLRLLTADFPYSWNNPSTWPHCAALLPHAIASLDDADLSYPHLSKLADNVITYYQTTAQFAASRPLSQVAFDTRRRVLGPEHPDTLHSMNDLAVDMRGLGEYAAARDLDQQTLEIRRRILGPEHPDTTSSMGNLAGDLRALGEQTAARDLHQQNLEIRRRVLGPEHPMTLISMSNLAISLEVMGEYAAALDLDQRTLEIRRRVLVVLC